MTKRELLSENQQLRKAIKELLDIDFEKKIHIDIAYYDLFVLSSLDRFARVKETQKNNPEVYELMHNYHIRFNEIALEFIGELKGAVRRDKKLNSKVISMF